MRRQQNRNGANRGGLHDLLKVLRTANSGVRSVGECCGTECSAATQQKSQQDDADRLGKNGRCGTVGACSIENFSPRSSFRHGARQSRILHFGLYVVIAVARRRIFALQLSVFTLDIRGRL